MLPQRPEPKHSLPKLVDFILFIVFKMGLVVPRMDQSEIRWRTSGLGRWLCWQSTATQREDLTLDAYVKARRVSSLVLGGWGGTEVD